MSILWLLLAYTIGHKFGSVINPAVWALTGGLVVSLWNKLRELVSRV